VQISQLHYGNDVVFYGSDPALHNYNVLPEYMTTTERGGWEWVWVIYSSDKNPYLKPVSKPIIPAGLALSGLINSVNSDFTINK
jgi:hypothetical protein